MKIFFSIFLKTNENISLTNNVSSICLSDVILPALIAKS